MNLKIISVSELLCLPRISDTQWFLTIVSRSHKGSQDRLIFVHHFWLLTFIKRKEIMGSHNSLQQQPMQLWTQALLALSAAKTPLAFSQYCAFCADMASEKCISVLTNQYYSFYSKIVIKQRLWRFWLNEVRGSQNSWGFVLCWAIAVPISLITDFRRNSNKHKASTICDHRSQNCKYL